MLDDIIDAWLPIKGVFMEVSMIKLSRLKAGQKLRYEFDERTYHELKTSVANIGIIFPIVTTKDGASYKIIDGNLRLRAMKELGWKETELIPVLILKASGGDGIEAALIANAVRENLSSLGLAEAVNLLVNKYQKSVVDIALTLGKSKVYIYRLLKIYDLPEKMLKALRKGEITIAHAHWLTKLLDQPLVLDDVFERAVTDDLAYRDLETMVAEHLDNNDGQKSEYSFFSPKVVTTKAGSRLRFEPRRNSIRLELNLLHDDIETALDEVKKELEYLRKRHLKVVG